MMNFQQPSTAFRVFALFFIVSLVFAPGNAAFAFVFNPNNIISNNDATNNNDMSRQDIQNFLIEKQSRLAYYETFDKNGILKTAAQVIKDAAMEFSISARFLIVSLQKEQSLITHPEPSQDQYDWAMGYAICDNCSRQDPAIQRWKGFPQQVRSAAAQFRDYFDNSQKYTIQTGKNVVIDDTELVPENQATANLYIYTPHIAGNKNFARIWNRWFGDGTDIEEILQKIKLPYPDGSLLQVEGDETIWYIKNGQRKEIASKSLLKTRFAKQTILLTTTELLNKYPVGGALNFPQYSILRDEAGNLYLIVNESKRRFDSEEIFTKLGYNPEEILEANSSELERYINGLPITVYSTYLTGKLVQDKTTKTIYYIENGTKQPIIDPVILSIDFAGKKPEIVSSESLDRIMETGPYRLSDAHLIKSTDAPEVYVISNGERRLIVSEEVFNKIGYNWKAILTVPSAVLEIHPIGEPVTGE